VTPRVVRIVTERFHRDVEDRPLREGRTPPEYLREGDIEYKQCPYSGARHEHARLMNVSALRQTSAHWDEILDALAVLRSGYVAARRGDYKPDVMDIWRVSQLGSALPWWFIVRGEPVPAYAAALSKATLGVGIWAQQMLMQQVARGWQPPQLTADTMMQLVEESGTLIGRTEVCSGSEKMLIKFFEVYVDGSTGTGALADKRDEVVRFGAHYAQLKLVMWLYYLARRYLYWDVGGQAAMELLESGVEPPDFFIAEPPNAATVPAMQRAAWFAQLSKLVVSFAPDGSDAAYPRTALQLGAALGVGAAPSATFETLDQMFANALAVTETAFGGDPAALTIEVRDSLIAPGTRAFFLDIGGS
jgi:hypothetical protein